MNEFEIRVSMVTRKTATFVVWARDKEHARELFTKGAAQRVSQESKRVEGPSIRIRKAQR